MKYRLSATEARIIGSLLEKQVTTPEQYPMSVNGVMIASNQKSNRDPVMNLSEIEVQATLDALLKHHFLSTVSGLGNRVVKYEQRFCNSEFGDLILNPQEVAIVTTLLLRGAQTPGELRIRTARMYEFGDIAEVEATLETLTKRDDGPFVLCLPREPGKREHRYQHVFGDGEAPLMNPTDELSVVDTLLYARIDQLERDVIGLKQHVEALLALTEV